jgi:NAD(P)-dependent dehydrogenase (short-subunit alcohol dehydrogenase family)
LVSSSQKSPFHLQKDKSRVPLNPKISDWNSRRVWIVGASTGIGRALALALLARGARVAVSARKAQALQEIVQGKPAGLALPLDVTQAQQVSAACASITQAWGGVDLMVYCAGTYAPMRGDEFDLQSALFHDDVNYRGALIALDAVLAPMVARKGGSVALVSSVAGYSGLPKSLAYGPTKAALINLAEALYIDLHEYNIGVHLVSPGFVETPLTAQNEFTMPALITSEQAAQHMITGFEKGVFEIHFPKRFTRWLKVLRLLPYTLYFSVIKRFTGI